LPKKLTRGLPYSRIQMLDSRLMQLYCSMGVSL
jgi:hypothetical protein